MGRKGIFHEPILGAVNLVVIVLTFVLFALSLFFRDLVGEIFLESAVFLVSVKLIIGTYQTRRAVERLNDKLEKHFTSR